MSEPWKIREALEWWVDAFPKFKHAIQSHVPSTYCNCSGCHMERVYKYHRDLLGEGNDQSEYASEGSST